ncbi:hypothetical protein BG005_005102, partial [Podila minutissima]
MRSYTGNGTYRIEDNDVNLDTVHVDRLKLGRLREHMVPEVLSASCPIRRGV